MRFCLDENFPRSAKALLEGRGHEVFDVRDSDIAGCDDHSVFQMAQTHEAVLLTTDRDFFHTIPHLFDHHSGVVVIALRQPNRDNILNRLEWFLTRFGSEMLDDRVFQLRDTTCLALPA